MKTTKRNLLSILSAVLATLAHAAPPQVTNISYSQRTNTKQVDIRYDLAIDAGEKAYVEFFFSHDNGATFPIICQAMTGDAGPGISPGGGKTAVWDAGVDWNKQFTEEGRIRIKVTYGDQPTGTPYPNILPVGSGSFETVEIPFVAGIVSGSPGWGVKDFYEHVIPSFTNISGPPKKYFVDDREVTNAKWDEVVEFSKTKGYDLEKVPAGSIPDMPRTNVSFLDAVKWCNARSEMEGFTPVYYVDPEEAMEDMNGDGAFTNGPDYVYPRTEEEQQNYDWEKADLNQNLVWDPGEPFIDKNSNGKFDPNEFIDFNQNGKRDTGLTLPFRVGDLTAYVTFNAPWWPDLDTDNLHSWRFHHHEMPRANGYRLPRQGWADGPEGGSNGAEFYYLAMGGHGENTGVAYKEEWPWGANAPAGNSDLSKYVVTTIGGNVQSVPLPVGAREPSVYGLYDMIGNVAEWTDEMGILKDTTGSAGGFAGTLSYILEPVGGSYRGLPNGSDTFEWAMNGLGGIASVTPSSVMVAGEHADRNGEPWVGFRSMRVEF